MSSAPAATDRIHSIDVFRGLSILLMVFVNDLSMGRIQNVPALLKHPKTPDTMTIADLAYPSFLFIVGLAIPLAFQRRLDKGQPRMQILLHVLVRTASLMVIGLCMGNMRSGRHHMDPIGMSKHLWTVLLLVSFIIVWNSYPQAQGLKRAWFIGLRLSGIALLVYLVAVFREEIDGEMQWMQCRWYIIGKIGWSYLVACIGYCLFRRQLAGMMGFLALLVFIHMGDKAGAFNTFGFLDKFREYVSIGGMIGRTPTLTVAGVVVGMLFMAESPARTPYKRILWILAFAAGLFVAGFLLRPAYGLGRGGTTITGRLYCAAICCVVYAFLYWLTDVHGIRRWSNFTLAAGRNPLLPYFLSFMVYPLLFVLHLDWLIEYWNTGIVGMTRSMCFTVGLAVFMTALLSRMHVRLKL